MIANFVLLVAFMFNLFFVAGALQGTTIFGTVSFPNGSPAPRVVVKIEGTAGYNRQMLTDDQGRYSFPGVPSGQYRLTAVSSINSEQFADPVETDTSRTVTGRLAIHLYLRPPQPKAKSGPRSRVLAVAEATQKIPKKARKAYEQGLKYRDDNKQSALALESFDLAVELFPDYFQALAARGEVRIAQQKIDLALGDFRRALEINNSYEPALRGMGYCLLLRQNYGEAAGYLERAVAAIPDVAMSHLFLGVVNLELGQFERAVRALRLALSIDSGAAASAHVYLAAVFARTGQYAEAADELKIYLDARPAAPNAARLRALEAQYRALATKR